MMTTTDALATAVAAALKERGVAIQHWIDGLDDGRTTRIEQHFAEALNAELTRLGWVVRTEQPLSAIGATQFYQGRSRGRVDLMVETNDAPEIAAEYKAVRMPRTKGGALFDIGQLSADFRRLQSAALIQQGYLVIFVYGPGVAASGANLWKAFHDQAYGDVEKALGSGSMSPGDANHSVAVALDWTQPWPLQTDPDYGRGVLVGDVGALIIECKD